MKKNRTALLTSILFLLNATIVSAAPFDLVNQKLRWIFFSLPASTAFAVWLKFAFFVIVFAALYNGGLRALKPKKPMARALGIISFVIALTTAIFVPYNLILYIFKLYGVILIVLFAALPVIVGVLINKAIAPDDNNKLHRFVRGIVYLALSVFLFGLIGHVEANSSPLTQIFDQVLPWLWGGAFVIFIFGIYNLIMTVLPNKKEAEQADKEKKEKISEEKKEEKEEEKKPWYKRIWPFGKKKEEKKKEEAPRDEEKVRKLQDRIVVFIHAVVGPDPNNFRERMVQLQNQYQTTVQPFMEKDPMDPTNPRKTAKENGEKIKGIIAGLKLDEFIAAVQKEGKEIPNDKQFMFVEPALKNAFENAVLEFGKSHLEYVKLCAKLEVL